MKPGTALFAAYCAAAALCMTAPASALAQQTELVIVDIKAVAEDIAKNIDVQASLIPLTVQTPIDVAANVCHVPASVLGAQGGSGGVSCAAMVTSPALERLVRAKLSQQ